MTPIWIDSLNPAQRAAVMAHCRALLVLAGAGSGKTRVLVYRIAWYITQQGVSSHSILAVTFTNKAAAEMRSRLESMVGQAARNMWVGTFHGLSHKLLRLHWKEAGLPENFQVIDSDDQLHVIKRIIKALNINEERWEPKKAQNFISRKKDEGIRAGQLTFAEGAYDQVMGDIYRQYEKHCMENGLVDFGELLLRSYEVLKNNDDLRAHYQACFLHFLVDEFQDTNTIQYLWLSLLAERAESVTVVGDDDQSIYGWRGAKIENIRRFEREFKGTELIRLEQNYRSTGIILSAANALIANNDGRMGKTLWTEEAMGDPIALYAGFNEEDEAMYVVREIRAWVEKGERLKDIGILYRSNAQSRVLEEALLRAGLPYSIYGGLRFFERAEIKDALAYLRLAVNPHDNTSFERVLNTPPRGIGEKTFEKIKDLAEIAQCSYWQASKDALVNQMITGKIASSLKAFIDVIEKLIAGLHNPLSTIVEDLIKDSGLLQFFKEQKGDKAQARAENLEELLNATHDFEMEEFEDHLDPLSAFLAYTALESGDRKEDPNKDAVQLMTLHSAKGLEFPTIFICGLEDGLFPSFYSRDNQQALEEERRLCYVGITRAMQRLHFTYAEKRRLFGRDEARCISRFVGEIPGGLLREANRRVTVNRSNILRHVATKETVANFVFQQAEEPEGFCIGQRVVHAKFGAGTIVDHEGMGERARVHVRFDMYGSKWLALTYAKLTPA